MTFSAAPSSKNHNRCVGFELDCSTTTDNSEVIVRLTIKDSIWTSARKSRMKRSLSASGNRCLVVSATRVSSEL